MQSFKIRISPTGEVEIEAEGFTGASCLETAMPLLNALGGVPNVETNLEYATNTEEEQQW